MSVLVKLPHSDNVLLSPKGAELLVALSHRHDHDHTRLDAHPATLQRLIGQGLVDVPHGGDVDLTGLGWRVAYHLRDMAGAA